MMGRKYYVISQSLVIQTSTSDFNILQLHIILFRLRNNFYTEYIEWFCVNLSSKTVLSLKLDSNGLLKKY